MFPASAVSHELAARHRAVAHLNERYVIERLVEAVSRFDYPAELLDVQVLDDSTDETCEVLAACVERHARKACHRLYPPHNREGYKAGALKMA